MFSSREEIPPPTKLGAGSSIDILNHTVHAIATGATHSLVDR